MSPFPKLIFWIFVFCYAASPAFAVEVAPRLTDREIIESLTELKHGQLAINKRFDDVNKRFDDVNKRIDDVNKRIDDLRTDINRRFEDINKRIDTNHQTMLAMFGTLVTLIVALFGYIAWDRRTLVKPIQEKLFSFNQEFENEKNRLRSLLEALRKLAQEDEKLAVVLRSFALL
ncbi:MAG: hypothetical protein HQL94_03250 [Magnetococcales bacterium]|nr:hypothetical protein [Magnetococcales bacterium]MBF0438090.1 hypothetical protein [Magnetococcales bacterium]